MKKSSCVLFSLILILSIYPTQGRLLYSRNLWDMILPEDPFTLLEFKGVDNTLADIARADWKETNKAHMISIDVPGMKKEDIKIEVDKNNRVLRLSGETKSEEEKEGEKWKLSERSGAKFWREFRLGDDADLDSVKGRLENGVLKITVEKKSAKEIEEKRHQVLDIIDDKASGEDIDASKAEM